MDSKTAAATTTLLEQIQALVAAGRWRPSDHGSVRMSTRAIPDADLLHALPDALTVESYPDDKRGPSVLALQYDRSGNAFHAVWGFAPDNGDALVITAYYPGLERWEPDLVTRRQ